MTMRNEGFAALILTHGRPDRVHTLTTLRSHGYTGRVVIVIDNEDRKAAEYVQRFGDAVVVFDKAATAATLDEGDNFGDRRAIIYARNASFDIARRLGLRYFIQLDDDYTAFRHKQDGTPRYIDVRIRNLDAVFDALVDYLRSAPITTIAMAQGGDFIGAAESDWHKVKRKAMNSFVCDVARPFQFFGRINEDVNTYTHAGSKGAVFLTTKAVGLVQKQTQGNAGGMTDLYLDSGTYVKSWYSVMYQPSSVRIATMNSRFARIHHQIDWDSTVPKILHESYRKPRAEE